MTTRIELHEILCDILGNKNAYFQPPETLKMKYPAIRYSRYDIYTRRADGMPYNDMTAYQITVIDPNPDSEIVDKVKRLPYCSFDRHYEADNLNHDVFTLYV